MWVTPTNSLPRNYRIHHFYYTNAKRSSTLQNVTVVAPTRNNESIETSTTKVEVLGLERNE